MKGRISPIRQMALAALDAAAKTLRLEPGGEVIGEAVVVSAHADAESDVHAMGKPPVGNRPVAVIPRLPMLACQWSLEISGRSMPNRKIGRARYGRQRLTGAATEEGR